MTLDLYPFVVVNPSHLHSIPSATSDSMGDPAVNANKQVITDISEENVEESEKMSHNKRKAVLIGNSNPEPTMLKKIKKGGSSGDQITTLASLNQIFPTPFPEIYLPHEFFHRSVSSAAFDPAIAPSEDMIIDETPFNAAAADLGAEPYTSEVQNKGQ